MLRVRAFAGTRLTDVLEGPANGVADAQHFQHLGHAGALYDAAGRLRDSLGTRCVHCLRHGFGVRAAENLELVRTLGGTGVRHRIVIVASNQRARQGPPFLGVLARDLPTGRQLVVDQAADDADGPFRVGARGPCRP